MRRTIAVFRDGLVVAAAAVALSACGGSDDDEASSSAAQSGSSAPESSEDAAGSEFCTEAAAIEERIGTSLQDQSDLTNLPEALQQAADEVRAVEPPPEIASDWNALADGVEQIAEAIGSVDFNDPDALATFEQQVVQLEAELQSASTNVENYLRDECGIEPSSPTS